MSSFDIFERFSETSRRVLITGQNIAQSMKSGIESPHVLIALTATPGSLAYDILREHMISGDQIRHVLLLDEFHSTTPAGMSEELKKVVDVAATKAAEFNHYSIESEHLLLALVTLKSCHAYGVIERIGVNPGVLRSQIEALFEEFASDDEVISQATEHVQADRHDTLALRERVGVKTHKSTTPALDYFTTDLTKQARDGRLDPVIGREREINRVMQILCRRVKSNPILTGEAGIGKTAIIEGLAQRIVAGYVPTPLKAKRIAMLDMALLVAGTTYRGQFEDRVKKVMDELVKSGNTILFIDEMHTLVGAGSAEGSLDMANILKPALAKGHLRVIGATTSDEYRKFIERDPALERRLQPILVHEPNADVAIAMLQGVKAKYEAFHGVTIEPAAIEAAVKLSDRYVSGRALPDKAIDLIDEAAASLQLKSLDSPVVEKLTQLDQTLVDLHQKIAQLAKREQFEQVGRLTATELKVKDEIQNLAQHQQKERASWVITADDIAAIVAATTGIPVTSLLKTERINLLQLENRLKESIVGQDEAVAHVARAIRRGRSGVSDPARPLGSFLFLGPTGVGKTEMARVLARYVFGRQEALIKVDMSEFMERHNISRLVGAPPGYIGFEEAGKLTEIIRKQPYSVVLFDEIEKAHPDVLHLLLQIMDEGTLTDAKGRRVNFRHAIIILTSNIGMAELTRHAAIGFQDSLKNQSGQYAALENHVRKALKETFQPEFLNRLDQTIIFKPLGKADVIRIVGIETRDLVERLRREFAVTLELSDAAKELIAERGFDPEFGARPIKRAVIELLHDPLSEALLAQKFKNWPLVRVLRSGDRLVFRK